MRIFPEMCPRMTCPFSSLTRKVALGRVSMISPCIWITSSFAIFVTVVLPFKWDLKGPRPLFPKPSPGRRESPSPEAPLFEQALVLVRHDVGLHLRHEVHGHHDDDEDRGAAEVEPHGPPQGQVLVPATPLVNQPAMVAGNRMIDEAKIGGMTPDMLSLKGRCEACPP